MSRNLLFLSAAAVFSYTSAMAEVPDVTADIAPVHSLVARVMDGIGAPTLLIQPGASPHEYSLRPSEAAALQEADLVFWVGDDLTPWLTDALASLSRNASMTSLIEADGIRLLSFRENTIFTTHKHEQEHDASEQTHGHNEHEHDNHAGHEHGHDHAHGADDPHVWLSLNNAKVSLDLIAAELAAIDPDNASAYQANATEAKAELDALRDEVNAILAPARDGTFIGFHDAYQYFEDEFDFESAGAISLGDAVNPSPARLSEIQQHIRENGVDCVLAEPQFNAGIVAAVLDGTEAKTATVDPIGAELEVGPKLYPDLIRNLARNLADCMSN